MEIKITVERRRGSVTQGMVDVLINGEKVMDFGDTIELIKPGEEYHGPIIGGWASKTPDAAFILGMLYHPHDDIYHISEKVKKALENIKAQEERDAPVFTELQRVAQKTRVAYENKGAWRGCVPRRRAEANRKRRRPYIPFPRRRQPRF